MGIIHIATVPWVANRYEEEGVSDMHLARGRLCAI